MVSCVRKAAIFIMSAAVLLRSTFASHHRYSSSIQEDGCRPGMYDDRQRGAQPGRPNCRPCSRCMPGYGAISLCTRYNDTECLPCSPGDYSATKSSLDSCISCTRCGNREPEEVACTVTSDAVCRKHCPIGSFYSPFDKDCLLCSYCHNYPHEAKSAHVQQCEKDGMLPDIQCWPMPSRIDQVMSSELPTTVAYHRLAATPSPRPDQASTKNESDNTVDMTGPRMYTVIILVLLVVVGLCVTLSINILICLCRVVKMSTLKPYQRTNSGSYECISKKTSNLLVTQPTYV